MKIYDLVKKLLEEDIDNRNSDKKLIWCVWESTGYVSNGYITFNSFINSRCPNPESIRRCRQKIQETHPELQATLDVRRKRQKKEADKGTFVFRETISDDPIFKQPQDLKYEPYTGTDGRTYYREVQAKT